MKGGSSGGTLLEMVRRGEASAEGQRRRGWVAAVKEALGCLDFTVIVANVAVTVLGCGGSGINPIVEVS